MRFTDLDKQSAIFSYAFNNELLRLQQNAQTSLTWRTDTTFDGHGLMHVAAAGGAVDTLEWLLDQGGSIDQKDEQGNTALTHAIAHNHILAAKFLVSHGASLLGKDGGNMNAALVTGCINNCFDILQWSIESLKAELGDDFLVALSRDLFVAALFSCYKGHCTIVTYLISILPDLSTTEIEGDTLLFCAACEGHVALTQYLLNKGSDALALNHLNETPLEATLKLNQTLTAKVILKFMIDKKLPLPSFSNSHREMLLLELQRQIKKETSPRLYVPEASLWSISSDSSSSFNASENSTTFIK